MHWAAGVAWHGVLTPARPLRILLIEAEGPRPEFRRKLRRRLASWNGPSLEGRLDILSEPWGAVTLRDQNHREQLARLISEGEYDIVVIGPLRKIGMRGGGTLDEIEEFIALVENVSRLSGRRVAFRIVHHENRAGQISGAWEGVPDTLVHVQPQGNGSLRLYWQKVKWASALHLTTTQLSWADGDGFSIVDKPEITEATIADEILEAVRDESGSSWTKLRPRIRGNDADKARIRDRLIRDGVLVNTATREGHFNLWRADDPAAPRADVSTGLASEATPRGASETDRATVPYVSRHGARHGTDGTGSDDVRHLFTEELS